MHRPCPERQGVTKRSGRVLHRKCRAFCRLSKWGIKERGFSTSESSRPPPSRLWNTHCAVISKPRSSLACETRARASAVCRRQPAPSAVRAQFDGVRKHCSCDMARSHTPTASLAALSSTACWPGRPCLQTPGRLPSLGPASSSFPRGRASSLWLGHRGGAAVDPVIRALPRRCFSGLTPGPMPHSRWALDSRRSGGVPQWRCDT